MAIPTLQEFEDAKRDLDDLEAIINGTVTVPTRLGGNRSSIYQILHAMTYDFQGAWLTSTLYLINELVLEAGAYYKCLEEHTSGTFGTDLSSGKWILWQGGDTTILTHRGRLVEDVITARFATVTAMIADINLVIGDVVETFANQNGAVITQKWDIVAAATGTPDGGSYIDLTGSGLQAKQVFDGQIAIEQFGAAVSPAVSTLAMQNAVNYAGLFNSVKISKQGTYIVSDVLTDSVGIDLNCSTLKADASATSVLQLDTSGYWKFTEISDGAIDGNSKNSYGVEFYQVFAGRYIFDTIDFTQCSVGVNKPEGNIGNRYYNCSWSYCDFGVHCTSVSTPTLMHSGADVYRDCHFGFCDIAAIYIDSPAAGTGQVVLDGCIFEQNAGFGIFVKRFEGAGNPLELRNVWFENNHTAPTVTIDSVVYTPKDIYLKDTSQAKIYGSVIQSVHIENSDVMFEQCKTFATYDFTAINSKIIFNNCLISAGMSFTNCNVLCHNADIGGYVVDVDVVTAKTLRSGAAFRSTTPLTVSKSTGVDGGVFVTSFDGTSPNLSLIPDFGGGKTFPTCLSKTASGTGRVDAYSFSVTANNYYYVKVEMRLNSVDVPLCYIKGTGSVINNNFGGLLRTGKWVTLHLLGQATNTGSVNFWCEANGGSIDLSFGACTIVQVTDFSKIHEFFNSGIHISTKKFSEFNHTSVPATVQNHTINSVIYNSNPVVDANNMILNKWVYDGATWRAAYESTVSPAN